MVMIMKPNPKQEEEGGKIGDLFLKSPGIKAYTFTIANFKTYGRRR